MHTVLQRARDNRTLASPHVTYGEAAGHRWLIAAAADHDHLDAEWPGLGSDAQIDSVIALVEHALRDHLIVIDTQTIANVKLERITDQYGSRAGFRLLVTTTDQLTLATAPMWASDAIRDERGMHGALNVLWVLSWEIHDLMEALVQARPQRP